MSGDHSASKAISMGGKLVEKKMLAMLSPIAARHGSNSLKKREEKENCQNVRQSLAAHLHGEKATITFVCQGGGRGPVDQPSWGEALARLTEKEGGKGSP